MAAPLEHAVAAEEVRELGLEIRDDEARRPIAVEATSEPREERDRRRVDALDERHVEHDVAHLGAPPARALDVAQEPRGGAVEETPFEADEVDRAGVGVEICLDGERPRDLRAARA